MLDLSIAIPAGLALSPLMGLVALIIRIRLGSPVLFSQPRGGRGGTIFTLHKFRTMRNAQDERGRALPDEIRLTTLGKWLRALSLDELPQLWNVIRGEMSLVGPRPLLVSYLERYSPDQRRRLEVKPGITGYAQVRGRNALSWDEKFRLDVWYVDHQGLGLDLWILGMTFVKLFSSRGISASGHATMPEFLGSHICANPSTSDAAAEEREHTPTKDAHLLPCDSMNDDTRSKKKVELSTTNNRA